MTCKFCGSALEDNEIECPYCGHKTANAMAANMTSKFAPDYGDDEEYSPKKSKVSMPKKPDFSAAKKTVSNTAAKSSSGSSSNPSFSVVNLIASAVSIILSLIVLISIGGVKNQVKDMYQDMLSQFYQQQSSISQLSSGISSIDSSVASVGQQVTTSKESSLIVIDSQPTSVSTTIGRGDYATVFSVKATGSVEAIAWQKKDTASGEWVDIVFDLNTSINDDLGIQFYDNHYKGESVLYAVGLTQKAEGTYRAKLTDSYGTPKYTDPVTISFKTENVGE